MWKCRRESGVEDPVQITDAQRTEDENLGSHPRRPKRGALFDVGAGEQVGTGVLEGPRHLDRTMSVGVRLDDRDDAGVACRARAVRWR